MTEIIIDGRRMKTKERAHAYLARKKEFPSYYGKNLDALYDVLTSLSDVKIKVKYSQSIIKYLGEYGSKLINVINDAAKNNAKITVTVE